MSFWSGLRAFLRPGKVCVHVTMGDTNYTRVAGQLEDAGIPFYVKMGASMGGGEFSYDGRLAEYEIYVKREYEKEARSLLGTSDMI